MNIKMASCISLSHKKSFALPLLPVSVSLVWDNMGKGDLGQGMALSTSSSQPHVIF